MLYEKDTIIVGAGNAGKSLLSEYKKNKKDEFIIGFVDDDSEKLNSFIEGKKVIGNCSNLTAILTEYNIKHVVLALPSVIHNVINDTINEILQLKKNITIQILPEVFRYFDSPLLPELEDLSVTDLLDRDEYCHLDLEAINGFYNGKTILITGAGGSIGSEICRQLLKFNIKKIICIGRGEFSIYNLIKDLEMRMKQSDINIEVIYKIIDVKNFKLIDKLFQEEKPEIVFHAAAHKHVPLMEHNEIEAIQNNIMGTYNVLNASVQHGVKKFILISTDKAVNPVNIMGATKRVAELLTLKYSIDKGLDSSIVRFGNVLGSRGSVLSLFDEQIKSGGPITITDPKIKRYFMSIPEASLLVINAGAYSTEGEIFVLNMGKQYKVEDIAKKLLKLYNKNESEIKIKYTGLRPGEKLFEELYYDLKNVCKTNNENIFIIKNKENIFEKNKIEDFIEFIQEKIYNLNPLQVREFLKSVVSEYDYSGFLGNIRLNNKYIS